MPDHSDRIVELYDRHAESYDRDRGRTLFEKSWLDRFCTLLPVNGRLLDVGCGSGEPIARYFIEAGYQVTGVDSSSAMIALCRTRFPSQEWLVADMRLLALGRAFDGILAWDSFFHLNRDDQRQMFSIFRRCSAPGAALMFTSGAQDGVAMGTYHGEPLYHASLGPAEYRDLLADNDFEVREHVPEDPACGGHTIWLAQRK